MKTLTFAIALLLAVCACTKKQEQERDTADIQKKDAGLNAHHSASIRKVFEAHGGFDKWSSMQGLSYRKNDEQTVTNLQNRKILVKSDEQTIGFDGAQVWYLPDSLESSRIRFYHNLYFYFYAMPFVVGDPGVYYEDLAPRTILEKEYKGVKISYGKGIGDTPEDNYIVWYDPATYQMEWLMYTVTFTTGTVSEQYKLIKYDKWATFEGLVLPTEIVWYTYKDGEAGDPLQAVKFEDVAISKEAPAQEIFAMPEGAAVATMP